MILRIENCNNIDSGRISIVEGKLNIKYGPNGTGKSTVAKAIKIGLSGAPLDDLMPFKYRGQSGVSIKPAVVVESGVAPKTVYVFNEDYLSQFTFKPDELLENSFEVFIKTPAYEQQMAAIEALVADIKSAFKGDESIEQLVADLSELSNSFKLSKTGLAKSSPGYKALAEGNKCLHVPEGLEPYAPFLRDKANVSWIDWQQRGQQQFSTISSDCPFCAKPVGEEKARIERVSKEFDKTTIKHLAALTAILERLGDYFSEATRKTLENIVQLKDGIQAEHEAYLKGVKSQIDILINKLVALKDISGADFTEKEKVVEKLPAYKIDMDAIDRLASGRTKTITDGLNSKIEELIKKAGSLQGEINKQRKEIAKVIEKNETSINSFLANAGYKYKVDIVQVNRDYKLRLLHNECNEPINGGGQHLSYGERNAFALVLFMHECLSRKPDLVILDDPISSFDKNKKYAILDRLFRQDESLKGVTCLLLTHDLEPVIDTAKVLHRLFQSISNSSFIRVDAGVLAEIAITRNDIQTFFQIFKSVNASAADSVIKLIYLRRLYEATDDLGDGYELLSNLFHKRPAPEDHRIPLAAAGSSSLMTSAAIANGTTDIENKIGGKFDYASILARISDVSQLVSLYRSAIVGYEKLQVYRLIDGEHKSTIIRKYINEAYHIENDLICQLDPRKFDLIPSFVITECDATLAGITV